MPNQDKKIWGIHTLDDNLFLKNNVIAIGWRDMGDLSKIKADRNDFKDEYLKKYPNAKKMSAANSVGMLYRFANEVEVGDYVVFPSKSDRKINIGVIEGEYNYNSNEVEYAHQRSVKWLKHLPRTQFSQGALYEIGSLLTFFMVKNYADEYIDILRTGTKQKIGISDSEDNDSLGVIAEQISDTTKDYILKELSKNLKGYALEDFVEDLLKAMGYHTRLSKQGGDSGIDIIAYKDELPPRILVQVKSQDSDIKESVIQSLKGAMREGDYGLFVTLSNYTKKAQKYLDNTPIIRGFNGTELVELILKYYHDLSDKYKKMIPLKMVYIPVPKED